MGGPSSAATAASAAASSAAAAFSNLLFRLLVFFFLGGPSTAAAFSLLCCCHSCHSCHSCCSRSCASSACSPCASSACSSTAASSSPSTSLPSSFFVCASLFLRVRSTTPRSTSPLHFVARRGVSGNLSIILSSNIAQLTRCDVTAPASKGSSNVCECLRSKKLSVHFSISSCVIRSPPPAVTAVVARCGVLLASANTPCARPVARVWATSSSSTSVESPGRESMLSSTFAFSSVRVSSSSSSFASCRYSSTSSLSSTTSSSSTGSLSGSSSAANTLVGRFGSVYMLLHLSDTLAQFTIW